MHNGENKNGATRDGRKNSMESRRLDMLGFVPHPNLRVTTLNCAGWG